MADRRSEDAVYYDHMGTPCRDTEYHRRCSGRWRGEINLGKDGSGKRQRIKVSAKNKTDVYQKLKDKRGEIEAGIRTSGRDTVQAAVDTWLDQAMAGRAAKTVQTQRELLDPLLAEIGGTVLRDLTADDVREGLTVIAATRTTRTVRDTRASLVRAIPALYRAAIPSVSASRAMPSRTVTGEFAVSRMRSELSIEIVRSPTSHIARSVAGLGWYGSGSVSSATRSLKNWRPFEADVPDAFVLLGEASGVCHGGP